MGWSKYGDKEYVAHVLKYYKVDDDDPIGDGVATGDFMWPTPGFTHIGRGFGTPDGSTGRHRGLDINGAGINGATIVAVDGGSVVKAEFHFSWGLYVKIDHHNGFTSLYAHSSGLLVKAGENVSAGQAIAKVGTTGNSTGPHLHLEFTLNGTLVDPAPYLQSVRQLSYEEVTKSSFAYLQFHQ